MKKLITMCLLIIGLIVTGCGSSKDGSGRNININPFVSGVTPDGITTSVSNYVVGSNTKKGVRVTLTGGNFGSVDLGSVCYNGSEDMISASNNPVTISPNVDDYFSWSDNQITFTLLDTTRAIYPYGSFTVTANGLQFTTAKYNFGGSDLKNAIVNSVTPATINSFDTYDRNITISGSGFGNEVKALTLFDMSSTSNSVTVTPMVWSDNTIMFVVPSNLTNATSNIGIKDSGTGVILGNSSLSQFRYVVNNPSITGIYPIYATVGEEVTMFSQNGGFGDVQPKTHYNLTLNGYQIANVTLWSDSMIKFIVPDGNYTTGPVTVNLYLYNKSITSNSLNIGPYIEGIRKDAGGILSDYRYTISGYGFGQNSILNISDNGYSVTVNSISSTSITFTCSSNLSGKQVQVCSGGMLKSVFYTIP